MEEDDVVKRALDNAKLDQEHWRPIYDKAANDLKFLSDSPYAQWDEKEAQARVEAGLPVVSVDQLGQFVHQVANDIRQNTPQFTVIPDDDHSSEENAEAFRAIIRGIEYKSNADDVYDTAALNSVKSSIGFIRIDHDYSGEGFEQELFIKRVTNPLSCFIDKNSLECDGRDATRGIIFDTMPVAKFKKKWPDKDPVSFDPFGKSKVCGDDENIQYAEYFEIADEEKIIATDSTGQVFEWRDGLPFEAKRSVKKSKVKRYTLSGRDVLEETYFPGQYIPLIPVYGEEHWIEGERNLFSLIRRSKDAQKMYNIWSSLETEILLKQPNAPVMAAEGTIEEYAEDWKNPRKSMALRYKTKGPNGEDLPPPQRLEPPVLPAGIVNARKECVDDIKASMGLYSASIGQRSNETSGVAIAKRQQEGDVATFHFYDNLVRSITHVYRVLICAIPEIYDTPRTLRAIGKEEEPKRIGVNGNLTEDQKETIDLNKGKYTVRVVPGASYTTKRQEAAAFFSDVVSKQPELMQVAGDLLFKHMDVAGSEALAERMKKVIDPKFLQEDEDDPAMAALQAQIQQAEQVINQLQGELATKDAQTQAQKTLSDIKAQKTDLKLSEQLAIMKIQLAEKDLELATLRAEKELTDAIESEVDEDEANQLPPGDTSYNQVGV